MDEASLPYNKKEKSDVQSAPLHPEEDDRLEALLKYEILDSSDEEIFDELTQLASEICGTSISLISLVDADRQWFKSRVGLDAPETERSIAFCSHAILQDEIFEIEDAEQDSRFHDNPLVTGAPDIRFYAGKPLVTQEGMPIGTLCVIDQVPRKLTDFQKRALNTLSKQIISQLEIRLEARKKERMAKEREKIYSVLAHDLRSPFNGILNLSKIMSEHAETLTPAKLKEMASHILDSSITLYQVMDELLQWSELQLDRGNSSMEVANVSPIAEHAIDLVRESALHKQIEFDLQVTDELTALFDSVLLKTVLRNLVTNAVKYSPIGATVTIAAERNGDSVQIAVSDQGEGIPVDIKHTLFSQRVSSQTGTTGELGNGLGLSLAGDFVRKQGGRIWVDDSDRDGARIFVELKSSN